MRHFVFSDIHGCFDALIAALDKAGYDPDNQGHHLLFLGDAFDKNRQDYQTYRFLKEAVELGRCTWVLGNHDEYLLNRLKKHEVKQFCRDTIHNIALGINPDSIDEIQTLLDDSADRLLLSCPDYSETPHYVFTHGMIPFDKKHHRYDPSWRLAAKSAWTRFRNCNGMKCVLDGIKVPDKTIVVGHIGSYYGNILSRHPEIVRDDDEFIKLGKKLMHRASDNIEYFEMYRGDGVISIDGRCFDTGIVPILIVEE
jgi:hypothetical protein